METIKSKNNSFNLFSNTVFKRNSITADPPPIIMDDNVPVIDVRIFKFCLTISHTESITSSSVPIFVRIKLITPCWATENSSKRQRNVCTMYYL